MTEEQKEIPESEAEKAAVALEAVIPVGEHEEEGSEDGQKVRRKGVLLLPSLFTLGALFAGFYAIIAAMNGRFEAAAIAIFVAMFLDGLDGRVARMTHTQSAFGAELDSLSDMVSFGVAPALVVFSWGLGPLGRFGWAVAFIYVAGAAIRLARFNTQIGQVAKEVFMGLASPPAAALVAAMVWLCHLNGWGGENIPLELSIVAGLVTAAAGLLMVTNIPYHSFKGLDGSKGRVPFIMVLVAVLIISIIMIDPPLVLLLMAAAYAASGPVMFLLKKPAAK
ncbi:MAG: CDP-diacylglycerol--serine O-phosphatidyltransferase [Pseudomonadales bacterium]